MIKYITAYLLVIFSLLFSFTFGENLCNGSDLYIGAFGSNGYVKLDNKPSLDVFVTNKGSSVSKNAILKLKVEGIDGAKGFKNWERKILLNNIAAGDTQTLVMDLDTINSSKYIGKQRLMFTLSSDNDCDTKNNYSEHRILVKSTVENNSLSANKKNQIDNIVKSYIFNLTAIFDYSEIINKLNATISKIQVSLSSVTKPSIIDILSYLEDKLSKELNSIERETGNFNYLLR